VEGSNSIVVRVLKYDGTQHRTWPARVVKQTDSLLVLDAVFDEHIEHDLIGTIARGTVSTEYYWLDRWYNVFKFSDPSGSLMSFYCNINMPPSFDGHVLQYVDLDVDILVKPDFAYQILDLEDFAANARAYNYPFEVRAIAQGAMKKLIQLIETRSFPFDE
jgi:protein associated with RNAse G/E